MRCTRSWLARPSSSPRAGERQRELLRTEQAARAAAEAARARLAFLSHVGAVLGASLDHRQVLSRLSTLLVPRYASRAQVWLVTEHEDLELYRLAGDADPPEVVRRVRVTRRPEQVTPSGPGSADGEGSLLVVPLVSLGTVLGVLTVTPPGQPSGRDDVIIVGEAAGRAAAALANALRFEQEREVAQRLQHAMLTELPTGPGVECAARYLPAVTGLNVGGDWYDAFLPPGRHARPGGRGRGRSRARRRHADGPAPHGAAGLCHGPARAG